MHMIHKQPLTYEYDYTGNFDTPFRPPPEVVAYLNTDSIPIGMKTHMIKTS